MSDFVAGMLFGVLMGGFLGFFLTVFALQELLGSDRQDDDEEER